MYWSCYTGPILDVCFNKEHVKLSVIKQTHGWSCIVDEHYQQVIHFVGNRVASSCVGRQNIACVSVVEHTQSNLKLDGKHFLQVSRAAVEGYTGEGEPPCIVMTLRADSDETTPSDLSLPVALTGLDHSLPSAITLKIEGERFVDGYGFKLTAEQPEEKG